VGVEAVVLAVVAVVVVVAVAPFSPGISPLALGASPSVPAASAHAYPPWCLPSVALSASGLSVFWVRPHTRGCPSRCFLGVGRCR
jgi:hypothetical protein